MGSFTLPNCFDDIHDIHSDIPQPLRWPLILVSAEREEDVRTDRRCRMWQSVDWFGDWSWSERQFWKQESLLGVGHLEVTGDSLKIFEVPDHIFVGPRLPTRLHMQCTTRTTPLLCAAAYCFVVSLLPNLPTGLLPCACTRHQPRFQAAMVMHVGP